LLNDVLSFCDQDDVTAPAVRSRGQERVEVLHLEVLQTRDLRSARCFEHHVVIELGPAIAVGGVPAFDGLLQKPAWRRSWSPP
jgi:hypothetical protein